MGIFSNRIVNVKLPILKESEEPVRIILIENRNDVNENLSFLHQFEKDVYIKNFLIEEEREPFETILDRIRYGYMPKTLIVLITEGKTVVGGCVSDYYPQCEMLEPIYLAVRPEYRRMGFGRLLVECSLEQYPSCNHMFVEVDNPGCVKEERSAMPPTERIQVYKRMGFDLVPISYIQPPLVEGYPSSSDMFLMHRGKPLDKETLKEFLHCFYEGLDALDSPYLTEMCNEIDASKTLL